MPEQDTGKLIIKSLAIVCSLLAARLPVLAADKPVCGPFVVNVGPRSATAVWVVDADFASGTAGKVTLQQPQRPVSDRWFCA